MADSLARYYNSQVTAHIGFAITSVGVVFATFLATWFSLVWPLWQTTPVSILAPVLSIPMWWVLSLYLLGDFVPLSLPYFYGRVHYYLALSEIAWLCMGLRHSPNAIEGRAIKARAIELSLFVAILSVFQARLFVSRCFTQKQIGLDDERIKKNLDAFDIKIERSVDVNGAKVKIKEQDLYLGYAGYEPFYTGRFLGIFDKLDDLLYLVYRPTIRDYLRMDKCPVDHKGHRIGRLLSLDFKEEKCGKCSQSL